MSSIPTRAAIHPEGLAKMNAKRAGEKYCPSSGIEGDFFINAWCGKCARDRSLREGVSIDECDDDEKCDIVTRTFVHRVDDAKFPSEWQYGKDGQPCCTAFVEFGQPVPSPRCAHTTDMFEATK